MDILNKIFSKLEYWKYKRYVNIMATIYLNLRTLPFKQALKLPLLVYGKVTFASLRGRIIFDCPHVKRGMVKMGRHQDDYILHSKRQLLRLDKDGSIVVKGYCSIASDFLFKITTGTLVLGDRVWIGQGVCIDCNERIEIGDCTSITYSTVLSDSNHHFVIDANKVVRRMSKPIALGKYNWIGNNSIIDKGSVTTDYSIVTHGSLLNKNYRILSGTEDSLLLAGTPAKILKKGLRRIFESTNEKELKEYFKTNIDKDSFIWIGSFHDECELKYFL